MLTLYRAHSVISDLSGRDDVVLQWFRVGRSPPVLPYEELIDYRHLEAAAKASVRQGLARSGCAMYWLATLGLEGARARRDLPEFELDTLFGRLEWAADALLTPEELRALQAYLGARHALDVAPEAVAGPLTYDDALWLYAQWRPIPGLLGDLTLYKLSTEEAYALPFPVWGKIARVLVTDGLPMDAKTHGVRFLQRALHYLGHTPAVPRQRLGLVVKALFEEEGLFVRRQRRR
jgi:hypothetical protein